MNLIEVGYFSKTHGLKGQLHLNITTHFSIEICSALFVQLPSGQSPQFIAEFRETKNGFIISLEELDHIDKAKLFIGKKVLVDEEFILESDEDNYVGFKLIDETFGDMGIISSVENTGTNPVMHLTFKGKEILLPLTHDLVKKIEDDTKTIYYKSPQGLIDMYLT